MQQTSVRVLIADPGGAHDGFFATLLQADRNKRKIYVLAGQEWKFVDGQIDYPVIEQQLAHIHNESNIDFLVVEKNNTGLHVIQSLVKNYHISVFGITTSNNIKNRKIIQKGETMDKNEQVGWINQERTRGNILKPNIVSTGVQKIFSQLDSFVKKKTPSGKITYSSQGNQPDDAAMTILLGTFFIRRKIFGDVGVTGKRNLVFKKYNTREKTLHIRSAIPDDCKMLGRTEVAPLGNTGNYKIH
jgi:hypothetical protein